MGAGGTSLLLQQDLAMLAWLVVRTLPVTRKEDGFEEVTHLTLPLFFFFFNFVSKQGDKVPVYLLF